MNEAIKKFIEPIRKSILRETDYTQLPDAPLSEQKKAEWAVYRQEIRDMPTNQTPQTVEDVVWPTKPADE